MCPCSHWRKYHLLQKLLKSSSTNQKVEWGPRKVNIILIDIPHVTNVMSFKQRMRWVVRGTGKALCYIPWLWLDLKRLTLTKIAIPVFKWPPFSKEYFLMFSLQHCRPTQQAMSFFVICRITFAFSKDFLSTPSDDFRLVTISKSSYVYIAIV